MVSASSLELFSVFVIPSSVDLAPDKTDKSAVAKFKDGERVCLNSYNYLGLLGNFEINNAAKRAIDEYGTGSGGVRCLSGSRLIHKKFEEILFG